MNLPERNDLPSISVRRPVLVLVANLLIVIAGIAALVAVEIRELPDVDRPVVTVRASFPGASPETMDAEVISLLEGAVARVSGIQTLRSASEENSGRIYIEFRPGVDLDSAAADVREAVSRVSRRLPDRLEQVVIVKADDDAQAVVNLAVSSNTLPMETLTHVVEQELVPMFIAIKGVADVQVSGDRKRMLRVALDPLRLTSYGLSVNDVSAALMQAPFDVPAGSFRSLDQQLIVRADATVIDPSEVADIVIRDSVRVSDVANVFFGPEDAETITRLDGKPVLGLGIIRQARSNTIEISAGVN
ncbi:MAG: efflux RND transporter permease subunit, partial [Woeseiaceae bacterium]